MSARGAGRGTGTGGEVGVERVGCHMYGVADRRIIEDAFSMPRQSSCQHVCLSLMVCVPSHSIVQEKRTPLMYAALSKSAQALALVALLLKADADVNARDRVSA